MPALSEQQHVNRSEVLSFEELLQVSSAAVTAGIKKIRITGGEPLVRRNIVLLCSMLAEIDGLKELTLTTNGVRLKQLAEPLFHAGVKRVNISLDTLNRAKFARITGKDRLTAVLAGIQEAEKIGMAPIKINTVVMRSVNDNEVSNLADLSINSPYHVRFIEMMPFDKNRLFSFKQMYLPIKEIIPKVPGLDQAHKETDLKSSLRNGGSQADLIEHIRKSILHKPQQHRISATVANQSESRSMYAIGG